MHFVTTLAIMAACLEARMIGGEESVGLRADRKSSNEWNPLIPGDGRRQAYVPVPQLPQREGEEDFLWIRAGGEFGLSGDWREAVLVPGPGSGEGGEGGEGGKDATIRGEKCMADAKQEEVRQILERRNQTPVTSRVAACVRTKNFGRFLPEWIAYHYTIGVEEITVYDDNSDDDTVEVLAPFIDAGLVRLVLEEVDGWLNQMIPLNHCLEEYSRRRLEDSIAPRWVLFHDTDEYILPLDTSATISQALGKHDATCCVRVPRVTYGSGGHDEMPRGLLLEVFRTHAHVHDFKKNRLPKVAVNLETTQPWRGSAATYLRSMHNGQGCECDFLPASEMRINHYLGSRGDYRDKTRYYWKEVYSRENVEKFLAQRDANDYNSDTITTWACATREILARVLEGFDSKGRDDIF